MIGGTPASAAGRLVLDDLRRVAGHLTDASTLAGRRVLVTGGTGFFGRWLLALFWLLNEERGAGIGVTVLSRDPEGFLARHPWYRQCAWLRWLAADVRCLDTVRSGPIDLVLHAATDTSAAGHADPLALFDTILEGTRGVLGLAVRQGARRILLTGSGAQYGVLPDGTGVREDHPLACDSASAGSAYAEAKRAQETLALLHGQRHGIDVVLTRCFAFAGPGLPMAGHFAIGNFVRDAMYQDEIVLTSDGQARRSYLYGADLAVWLLELLARGEPGQAYNVGSDDAVSIGELAARVIARIAPGKPLHILGQPDGNGRSFYVPDIGKARSLGLDVWTPLDLAIDRMAAWAAPTACDSTPTS